MEGDISFRAVRHFLLQAVWGGSSLGARQHIWFDQFIVSGDFGDGKNSPSTKKDNSFMAFIELLVALLNSPIGELCQRLKRWTHAPDLWQHFFEVQKIHLGNDLISKEDMKCIMELRHTLILRRDGAERELLKPFKKQNLIV